MKRILIVALLIVITSCGVAISEALPGTYASPSQQLERFEYYNKWLVKFYPQYAIRESEISAMRNHLAELGPGALIYYGHGDDGSGNADVVLTARLAWGYIGFSWEKEQTSCKGGPSCPDMSSLKLINKDSPRPKGFYVRSLLEKERETGIIGYDVEEATMKFKKSNPSIRYANFMAAEVEMIQKKHYQGLGSEGFQFFLTHPHYFDLNPQLMIFMPDLAGDGDWGGKNILCLTCFGGNMLFLGHVNTADSGYHSCEHIPMLK